METKINIRVMNEVRIKVSELVIPPKMIVTTWVVDTNGIRGQSSCFIVDRPLLWSDVRSSTPLRRSSFGVYSNVVHNVKILTFLGSHLGVIDL